MLFSIPLGLLVARGRMSKSRIIAGIVRVYISIMRGTPLMLQLLLVYFGPYYVFGFKLSDLDVGPFKYMFVAKIGRAHV